MGKPWEPGRNVIFQCRKTGHEWTASQWRGSQSIPSCPIHRRKGCVQVVGIHVEKEAEGVE